MTIELSRPYWSTRLQMRRVELGYKSQGELSAATNDLVAQRSISHLESGSSPLTGLTAPRLAALARALNWTIPQMEQETSVKLISADISYPPPELEVEDRMIRIPLLGSVSAGDEAPIALEREFTGIPERELIRKKANRKNVYGYIVNGTSMMSDGVRERRSLRPGDTVAVERNRFIQEDDIVVAWDGEHERMLVKLVAEEGDWLVFKSLNSGYPPIMRRAEDVHIFGVVIWRGGNP